jgi:hypothetical protein
MRPIEEALKLTDKALLVNEINQRKKFGQEGVNTMYPKVLIDEINALSARISELRSQRK